MQKDVSFFTEHFCFDNKTFDRDSQISWVLKLKTKTNKTNV